jgi:hypothetical protein
MANVSLTGVEGQFEILELRAKDRMQQKRPDTVAGDAVHAQKDCEATKN